MRAPSQHPSPLGNPTEPRFPLAIVAGLLVAIATVLAGGSVADHLLQQRKTASEKVLREATVLDRSYALLTVLRDLEAAPLAYQLDATEAGRIRYEAAADLLAPRLRQLDAALTGLPGQAQYMTRLQALTAEHAHEAARAIALRSEGRAAEAAALVREPAWQQRSTEIGRLMEAVVADQQQRLRQGRESGQKVSRAVTAYIFGNALALLVLIALGAGTALLSHQRRRREGWLQSGQDGLAAAIEGEPRLDRLGDAALQYLRSYLGAEAGALYVLKDSGGGRRIAGQGLAEGAVGQWDAGAGPLEPLSAGQRSLLVPATGSSPFATRADHPHLLGGCLSGGRLFGGVALGFARPVRPEQQALLDRVAEPLGAALRSAMDTQRLNALLDQSLSMAEEMRDRRDELSAKTIVLSERTEHLNAAHAQLATQQAALGQVNTRLEEKMELLESQKEELRQSQDALVQQAVELERANRYKNNFLANMSHELRTPLNSALILSKVLSENRSGRLTAQEVSYAETIHSAGSDLLTLINDILDLAKIEAGRVTLHPERVLLEPAVRGFVRGFEPTAALKSLQLGCVLDPGLPRSIVTDEYRLGQIVKNLLSNAIKFTRAGEIELRVSPGSGGGVRMAVRDTGIGISEEHREHIFEAFRQADGSTHREFGGTGLGLSISRDLAQLLGGSISLRSTPGIGSVFTLELPAELPATAREPEALAGGRMPQEPSVPPPPRTTDEAPAGDRERVLEGRCVLLVEDDPRNIFALTAVLERQGMKVRIARNGREALTALAQPAPEAPVDLVLMDIMMPEMDGITAIREIRRDAAFERLPIIALTAKAMQDDQAACLRAGANDYMAKPLDSDRLLSLVRVWMPR